MCQRTLSLALLLFSSVPDGIGLDKSAVPSHEPHPPAVSVELGPSVVELIGPWKFQVGDNPAWSEPDYNDSSWETVDLQPRQDALDPRFGVRGIAPGWTAKGHSGYSGFAWYRIRVRIDGTTGPLALLGPTNAEHGYQIFADGRLIGSVGNFNRRVPIVYGIRPAMFRIPEVDSRNPHRDVLLAFRFYMVPFGLLTRQSGGMHVPPVIGLDSAITAAWHVAWEQTYRAISSHLTAAIVDVAFSLLILMLYAFDRKETILLWPRGLRDNWTVASPLVPVYGYRTAPADANQPHQVHHACRFDWILAYDLANVLRSEGENLAAQRHIRGDPFRRSGRLCKPNRPGNRQRV